MSFRVAEKSISISSIHEKYLFRKRLGKGGFGEVFLAEERETGNKVAINMIEIDSLSEKIDRTIARFRCEMLPYRLLDHPNIAKVIDSGETETGLLFIVFEYVHGSTLAQLLKREGKLSLARTMTVMGQVLAALNYAHVNEIIHRNLNMENIIITTLGGKETAKILDFGLSMFTDRQYTGMPWSNVIMEYYGMHPTYTAPEQLCGGPVSAKADIYAWGLLFLECITGKACFQGSSVAAIVEQQLAATPVAVPAALANHRLGTLLHWVLEKNADRRAGNALLIESYLNSVSLEDIALKDGFLPEEPMARSSVSVPDMGIYESVVS